MKKYVNGEYFEITPEEIAAMEQYAAEETPTHELTQEERIAQLETQLEEQAEINAAQDETLVEIYESMVI